MAPFRLGHDEYQHELPWRLMLNGPVTKYWRRDGFEEDIAEMQQRGFRVARFDCGSWSDEDMRDFTAHALKRFEAEEEKH